MFGAGLHIDMRIDAALRDQLQVGKLFDELAGDGCALAEQNNRVEPPKARRQPGHIRLVVGEYGDVDPVEPGKAGKTAKRVEPVIKDGEFHHFSPFQTEAGTNSFPSASLRAVRKRPAEWCRNPSAPSS